MFSIHDEPAIKALLETHQEKAFRYDQIRHSLYKDLRENFDDYTTLSKPIREILKENCFDQSIRIKSEHTSKNGQTTKFILESVDNKLFEMVIMRHLSGRNTLCISCQVGCPMACRFCATGKLGLVRNLALHEIVEQVMLAVRFLAKEQKVLRNIVFMGMGEPLLNYLAVRDAIRIFVDQKKFDLSSRRITISTCGIVPGIQAFTEDFSQISLAISLHAPNDEVRKAIMPVNHTYPLVKLMAALDAYTEKTNKRIFYEYVMIQGVNDKIEYAHELAKLLKWRLGHVNFIPYNPGEGIMGNDMQPSSPLIIKKFQSVLEKEGIISTVRATMGDDIDAACGQLALKEGEGREES